MTDPPERFHGVYGHAHVQARLVRAIERGQLHHAIILVGPRGVGKAVLARGLACALHCEEAPGRGCGRCRACVRIAAGHHAGVEWLEPEAPGGTIKVETARELANRLELAPFEGRHHVVVFDPAAALTEQACNALLKTIEEPRPGVHFVMIATELLALLPTILSRCLTIRVGRLADDDVRAILGERLQEREGDPVPDERLELAVRLAEGSAGVAFELAQGDSLEPTLALLGELMQAAEAGPRAIFAGDKSTLFTAWNEAVGPVKSGKPARERAVLARAAELWLLHLREALHGREGLPGLPSAQGTAPRILLARLDRIQLLLESVERNPNVRLALEQTLLTLGESG